MRCAHQGGNQIDNADGKGEQRKNHGGLHGSRSGAHGRGRTCRGERKPAGSPRGSRFARRCAAQTASAAAPCPCDRPCFCAGPIDRCRGKARASGSRCPKRESGLRHYRFHHYIDTTASAQCGTGNARCSAASGPRIACCLGTEERGRCARRFRGSRSPCWSTHCAAPAFFFRAFRPAASGE